ncbi:MAG: thiolase family protein [Firmicutes bacterium]|nr:thiolase family protein [Bacillota bacterium]
MTPVVIVSAVRTAVGRFGGALREVPPEKLGARVMTEALARAGVEGRELGDVIMGCVLQTNEAPNLARVAALWAGIPVEVPAYTVHRQCGSGLQAVISGAQAIMCGEARVVLAGGAESMSRAPYYVNEMRWGARLGHVTFYDPFVRNAESCSPTELFGYVNMGLTAENLAEKYGISREEQDAFALASHRKAVVALTEGRFRDQVVAVPVPQPKGKEPLLFDRDEAPRPDTSMEALSRLAPAFKKDGTVTAGNSCPMNDGAAAVVLMPADLAESRGLEPLGRVVSWAVAGVDPRYMGIGPVPATRLALERARLSLDQIDVIELNEAFAAQSLAVLKELALVGDPRVNPNGGAIALGHPVGATGAILLVKVLYEMRARGARRGLVTLCIGGGMGIALVVEAV